MKVLLFLHGLENNPEPSLQMKRRLDSIDATRGLKEICVATREDSGVLCFPSRRGLTPRGILECNPEIPAFPGEEHYVLDTSLDEVYLALQCLESNPHSNSQFE